MTASRPTAASARRSAASRPSSTISRSATSWPTRTSSPSSPTASSSCTPDHPDRGLARRRPQQHDRRDRRHGPARRCRRRDRRHRHRLGPGPQRRRRLQLLDVGPHRLARQEQPRDARRGHRRCARQRLRRRRRRAGGARVGRQDPQRRRLRPDLVVHLRPRLDPRPARPERLEPAAVRGGQHERHQGRQDDHNCGITNNDPLHQAICRVVAGGITVVAAAANDSHNAGLNIPASYNEVITVSALADTDGKPGGLGGNRCYSWGGYDKDDTFADFSNYGGDVDLIAPGKCILSTIADRRLRLHVGHVDGRPDRHRRGRAVQVEPPERDAGRGPRSAPLSRQPQLEGRRPTRTRPMSRCSTCRASARSGRSR